MILRDAEWRIRSLWVMTRRQRSLVGCQAKHWYVYAWLLRKHAWWWWPYMVIYQHSRLYIYYIYRPYMIPQVVGLKTAHISLEHPKQTCVQQTYRTCLPGWVWLKVMMVYTGKLNQCLSNEVSKAIQRKLTQPAKAESSVFFWTCSWLKSLPGTEYLNAAFIMSIVSQVEESQTAQLYPLISHKFHLLISAEMEM